MKFVLDANMPYSAKGIFKKPDKVVHVGDVGLADATDEEIIKYSLKEKAILITRDLDFANIILYPLGSHAGIIVLRLPSYFNAESIKKSLRWFMLVADKKILPGSVTIVEPDRYRIRRQSK